jgi:ABC-type antimicrobial peptide transport system permease subunit
MAILTAIVGSMGLAGTMGMNVLERTREIGIMRAIGADDRAVMRTVIAEGVFIGMISFGLAVILSIPFVSAFDDCELRLCFKPQLMWFSHTQATPSCWVWCWLYLPAEVFASQCCA